MVAETNFYVLGFPAEVSVKDPLALMKEHAEHAGADICCEEDFGEEVRLIPPLWFPLTSR